MPIRYSGWREQSLFITLTPTTISVKRHEDKHLRYSEDTSPLTPQERWQERFIRRHYAETPHKDYYENVRQHYIDSMYRRYPNLHDAAYYWQLVRKELVANPQATPYMHKTISITPPQYKAFVESLNASGYWQMPYRLKCDHEMADGPASFSLEANTPEKYNYVIGYSCPKDSNRFYKACEQLVRLAGLDTAYHLIWIERPQDTATNYFHPK